MSWSWRIARIAGIDIYVHATFLILIAWIAGVHWSEGRSIAAVIDGVAFILALFACVVAHEYGHALTARRYGIRTRDITLLPIGGVARLERMPDDPRQELRVAVAGPVVNVVIAAALFLWLRAIGNWEPMSDVTVVRGAFGERLMLVNVALVLFNLLPAFPMDGGRVLRALLAMRMEYTRATQIAGSIGQGMAVLFGYLGLIGNPFLIFIALFVWIGAAQETSLAQMKSALAGIPVRRAMLTDFHTVSPAHTLGDVVELLLRGSQQDFPVMRGTDVAGFLTRNALMAALEHRTRDTPVSEVMQAPCDTADASEMLETVLARLQAHNCRTAPVMHGGALVGLVTMDNVGEFLMIQAAERRLHRPQMPAADGHR